MKPLPSRYFRRPSGRARRRAGTLALCVGLIAAAAIHVSAQIVLEAEHGTLVGTTVTTAVPGYSGTGYVTSFNNPGDLVRWDFNATNGFYNLIIRYRSQYGEKGFDATINGLVLSGMFAQTNGFGSHPAGLVQLTNGINRLEIGGGWNYYEIDRADLIPATPSPPPAAVPATLVDPQATFAARMLMAGLVADYGRLTWSGQQELAEVAHVFQVSGRKPLIVSGDFMDYSPSRVERGTNPAGYTESIVGLESEGHAASMCWHWNAPTNLLDTPGHEWWRGFYTHATTFNFAAALANTNTPEYAMLLRDMDAIAVQLRKFDSNNIPVLWRPLHESEGGWFWWGAQGPEAFKQLWRLLYERLTQHHQLHNLLWVLTSEDPAWYPGDDVVDIVGVDAYPTDPGDPLTARWETLKARFDGRKLIALTEFGGVPDIERMQQYGVWFSYFAPWAGTFGPSAAPDSTVQRIYTSAAVLTLDEANARPARIISVGPGAGGSMRILGKGPRGAQCRLLASESLALPPNQWSEVATGQCAGGVFELADTQAGEHTNRFYRVVTP